MAAWDPAEPSRRSRKGTRELSGSDLASEVRSRSSPIDRKQDEFADLLNSIQKSPIATIVTDNRQSDNPIIEVNEAFLELTGYDRAEVIGRNCRFLAGAGTEPDIRRSVREAVSEGRPIVAELLNYRKDGSAFRNALMIAPVLDPDGSIALFVGSQMEAGEPAGATGLRAYRYRELVAGLPRRLREVLRFMCAGYQSRQIGQHLGIAEKTVKMHRARLRKALGVRSSADAIRIGLEAGLMTNNEEVQKRLGSNSPRQTV